MDKNIIFKGDIVFTNLEQRAQELNTKLRSIQERSGFDDKIKSAYGDSEMSKKLQNILKKQQTDDLEFLKKKKTEEDKILADKIKNLEKIDSLLSKQQQGSDKEQKYLENKRKLAEEILKITEKTAKINEQIQSIEPEQPEPKQPEPTGGGDGKGGGGKDKIGSIIKQIGVNAAILGAAREVSKLVSGTANLTASSLFEYEQAKSREQASVAQGAFVASGQSDIMRGRGIEAFYWNNERMRAMEDAQGALSGMTARGIGGTISSMAKGAGAGAVMGSSFGSALGIPGALAGGTIGGVAGAAYGGFNSLFSGQTGAYIRGMVNPNDTGSEAVDRYRSQFLFNEMNKNMEAQKNKDPYKKLALDYLSKNNPEFLRLQRMSGMGDDQLLDRLGEKTGLYTEDQKLQAMEQIGAIGSSSQMASIGTSLELSRNYGIQNANSIVGMLSQNLGGGQVVNDDTTKRILSDAFSVGLDASRFSRETEKFFTMSAQFVAQSGARTNEEMQAVAGQMGKFTIGTSIADIEAGGTARQMFNQSFGRGATDYQKSLQFSAMLRHKDLGKLSSMGEDGMTIMSRLTELNPDEIARGGPQLEAFAQQIFGDDPSGVKKLQEALIGSGGIKEYSSTITPSQVSRQDRIKQLRERLKTEPLLTRGALEKQLKSEESMFGASMGLTDRRISGLGQEEQLAFGKGVSSFGLESKITDGLPTLPQSGAFLDAEKAQARSEQARLETIRKKTWEADSYIDQYAESAKKMSKASTEFITAMEVLTEAIKENKGKLTIDSVKSFLNMFTGNETVRPKSGASGGY